MVSRKLIGINDCSVEVVANEHVNKFGPPLPPNGVFHDREQLRSFMHVKCKTNTYGLRKCLW